MKKLLGALVLGSVLMAKQTVSQQQELTPLTLEDVVEIIAEFDIIHQSLPQAQPNGLYGMVNFNSKRVYLNSDQDRTEMRDTVLHELYHIKARKTYCANTEQEVDRLAKETIKALYTKPPAQ